MHPLFHYLPFADITSETLQFFILLPSYQYSRAHLMSGPYIASCLLFIVRLLLFNPLLRPGFVNVEIASRATDYPSDCFE